MLGGDIQCNVVNYCQILLWEIYRSIVLQSYTIIMEYQYFIYTKLDYTCIIINNKNFITVSVIICDISKPKKYKINNYKSKNKVKKYLGVHIILSVLSLCMHNNT